MTAAVRTLSRNRPSGVGRLAASLAFAWRSLLKLRHVPEQMADVVFIPIVFTVLFTYLFGGALAGSTSAYLEYLLPGTLVQAVVILTIYSGVTINTDIAGGAYDRFRSMPMWRPAPLIGGLIGDLGRYAVAAALVLALGLLLGYRPHSFPGLVAAIGLVVVFASSLSWLWLLVGLTLRTPQAVQTVGFLVVVPMTFASNVFVDPATMPGWLQAIVAANPFSHVVTAVRGLLAGQVPAGDVVYILASSAALVAVLAPLATWRYGRGR